MLWDHWIDRVNNSREYMMTLTSLMKVLKTSNSSGMFSNSSAPRTYIKSFPSALEVIARRVEYPQEIAFFQVVMNCSTLIKFIFPIKFVHLSK